MLPMNTGTFSTYGSRVLSGRTISVEWNDVNLIQFKGSVLFKHKYYTRSSLKLETRYSAKYHNYRLEDVFKKNLVITHSVISPKLITNRENLT